MKKITIIFSDEKNMCDYVRCNSGILHTNAANLEIHQRVRDIDVEDTIYELTREYSVKRENIIMQTLTPTTNQ